jgi:hypothetical protein
MGDVRALMRNLVFLLFTILFSVSAWAYYPIAGGIPKEEKSPVLLSPPATDLYNYKENRVYLPFEVAQLFETSDGQIDLSDIDPDPTTDVWKPGRVIESVVELNAKTDEQIEVQDFLDEVNYVSSMENYIGTHRFSVEKSVDMGGFSIPKTFTVYAGRNVHNILLRKNLLRKIGYQVPAIKYVKKLVVHFESKEQKKDFLNAFSNNTPLSDHKRWITVEKDRKLILQDIVITEPIEAIYNFALGYMDESVPQGRRLINSLIVPFNLVDIPESINQFQWSAGRVVSENIYLPHEFAESFQATWHDARWISKKILELKESEIDEIVDEAFFPPTIAVIVKAKIKSRRNSISRLFDIDAEEFHIRENYSNGDCLIDNKVICEDWEGYAARFAYGDPESPLSASELTSFVKSKGWSTLLDAGMSAINFGIEKLISGTLPQTDVGTITSNVLANLQKNQDGVYPLTTWSAPILQGKLILNRNLIAGSFLGTDNILQLVDTIGFSVGAGVYGGAAGLPGFLNSTAIAGGSAAANIQRTYSHIRPISSVQKSLKYSFKNAAVPFLMRKYGKYFKEITSDNFNSLDSQLQVKRIANALEEFKKELEVGESLLITDTLGAGVNGQINGQLYYVNFKVGVGTDYMVLSRLHIHRKSENEIQIYRDFGNLGSVSIGLSAGVGIPILSASVKFSKGRARTKFFKIPLNEKNPKIIDYLTSLKSVFFTGSTRKLKRVQKPWELKHKFKQTDSRLGIFTLRLNRIKNNTYFSLREPKNGEVKNFYRRYEGDTVGNDYQAYVNELFMYFTGKALGTEFGISGLGGGNPGNSFAGKAQNKVVTFESEILPGGKLGNHMVKVTRIWNGWKMKRKKAKKRLEKLKRKYRFRFYSDEVLNNVDHLFLYNININFLFYPEGIDHALRVTEDEVKEIFKKYNSEFDPGSSESKKLFGTAGHKIFLRHREKVIQYLDTREYGKISKHLNKMLEVVEKKLAMEGMKRLFGGTENFFVYAKIDGFRDGNEDATNDFSFMEDPYVSHSLGEFGAKGLSTLRGPFAEVLSKTGMTTSELTIQWLLGRVY